MDIPASMRAELGAWNGGNGIDLQTWIGCEGRFALAVGYMSVFWPEFVEQDGYILRKPATEEALRDLENKGQSRVQVEALLNHLHLADIHYLGCPDASADKLIALGDRLREIHEAKLRWQFPDHPCTVSFYVPDNPDAFEHYELTFWQTSPEGDA